MAFAVKYRAEFSDMENVNWRVDILENNYIGDITILYCTGTPLIFNFDNDSDEVFDPIRETSAEVNVFADTNFSLLDLYSTEDRHFKVEIYFNESIYWRGFVDPSRISEPYDDLPYEVTIACTDGLNCLKTIRYKETNRSYRRGRGTIDTTLLFILGKISHTTFTEYLNIYETRMIATVNESPLDQMKINEDVFMDMYCDEVLSHILTLFNACIRQVNGVFCLYRPTELTGATVYGRTFTAAGVHTSTSFTPAQNFTGNLHIMPNGTVMIQSPYKEIIIHQDYGYKDSWLNNWEIKAETRTTAVGTAPFTGWSCTENDVVSPIVYATSEKDGALIQTNNTYPLNTSAATKLYQSFGTNAIASASDEFILEFDYAFYNNDGNTVAAGKDFYVQLKNYSGTKFLSYSNQTGTWVNTEANIDINTPELLIGMSDWSTFKVRFTGLPQTSSYVFSAYGMSTANDIKPIIKNVKFYANSTEIALMPVYAKFQTLTKGWITKLSKRWKYVDKLIGYLPVKELKNTLTKEYTKTNSIEGQEVSFDYILGDVDDAGIDNVSEQFNGALAIDTTESLTQVAIDFATVNASFYTSGGVLLTSSGADIIFTSSTAGTAFTGSTSISNVSGNLNGSLPAGKQTANVAAAARVDEIVLSGSSGTANVTVGGVTKSLSFNTDLDTTASDFVTNFASFYTAVGITVESFTVGSTVLKFTANVAGTDFTGPTSITNTSGNLNGSASTTTANAVAVAQVATITLSGSSGSANITCDGVTKAATVSALVAHSLLWYRRGVSENLAILSIIGDEIADQHSRPKQLLQLPILDTGTGASNVNILGNFQDDLNKVAGSELLSDWSNINFDTFTKTGKNITSALSSSTAHFAITNGVSLTSGEKVRFGHSVYPVELLSSWSNVTFDSFSATGRNITAASSSSAAHFAITNTFALTAGETLNLHYTASASISALLYNQTLTTQTAFTIPSGTGEMNLSVPDTGTFVLYVYAPSGAVSFSLTPSLRKVLTLSCLLYNQTEATQTAFTVTGAGYTDLDVPDTGTFVVYVYAPSNSNSFALYPSLKKMVNRAFIANRGSLDAKNRQWDLDLIEII